MTEQQEASQTIDRMVYLCLLFLFRYAAIGVLSWFNGKNDNIWVEVVPQIKSWIKSIAPNAQDSDCEASTTVSTPSVTTTTKTTTSKYLLVRTCVKKAELN